MQYTLFYYAISRYFPGFHRNELLPGFCVSAITDNKDEKKPFQPYHARTCNFNGNQSESRRKCHAGKCFSFPSNKYVVIIFVFSKATPVFALNLFIFTTARIVRGILHVIHPRYFQSNWRAFLNGLRSVRVQDRCNYNCHSLQHFLFALASRCSCLLRKISGTEMNFIQSYLLIIRIIFTRNNQTS